MSYSPTTQSEEMNTDGPSHSPHGSSLQQQQSQDLITVVENNNNNSSSSKKSGGGGRRSSAHKPAFPLPPPGTTTNDQQHQQKTVVVLTPTKSKTQLQHQPSSDQSFVDTAADYAEIVAQHSGTSYGTSSRNVSMRQKRRLTNSVVLNQSTGGAAGGTLTTASPDFIPAHLVFNNHQQLQHDSELSNNNNASSNSNRESGVGGSSMMTVNPNLLFAPGGRGSGLHTDSQDELPVDSPTGSKFNLRRAAIPLKEKFILNPWEKLKYYKRPPFKILINVLIITTLLVFIYGYFSIQAVIMRNERFGLVQFFFPDASDNTAASLTNTYDSMDDVISFIQSASEAYYGIPDKSSGIWMHFADPHGSHTEWNPITKKHVVVKDYIVRPPRLTMTLVKNMTRKESKKKQLQRRKDGETEGAEEASHAHQRHHHYLHDPRFHQNSNNNNNNNHFVGEFSDSTEDDGIIDAWDYYDSTRQVATETLTFDINSSTDYLGPFSPSEVLKFQQGTIDYLREHPDACAPRPSGTAEGPYLPCRGRSNATDFFDRILSMTLSMSLRGVRRTSSDQLAAVVKWNMNFDVSFEANRGVAKIHARFKPFATNHFETLPFISLSILLVLYSCMLVLYIRALWRYRRSNTQIQQILEQLNNKEKIQFREKLAGFSWRVFGVFSAIVGITFCCLSTAAMAVRASDEELLFWRDLSLASTFLFQWCLLLSHFQTIPEYYSGIKTVAYAIPLLVQFTAGILPMFIGFTILVFVNFGPFAPDTFGTISKSMQALFAASNGDSLFEFYTQMNQSENVVFRLWSFASFTVFLLYFCGHAQNVIMGIVQASYLRVNETFELNYWDDSKTDSDSSSGNSSSDSDSDSDSSTSSDTSSDTSEGTSAGTSSSSSSSGGGIKERKKRKKLVKALRRARRKQKAREFKDLSDPIAVEKLAKKLKKMRKRKQDVMDEIDQLYYVYQHPLSNEGSSLGGYGGED